MAISPIAIATHGLLNSPLSVAAVRGHLTLAVVVDPGRPPGSGSKTGASYVQGTWEHPAVRLDKQIRMEDEEIMVVIAAFMEVLGK